jgi:flavin reductase (DIM6/NTAB) family NADH-FMN oxidoreductase RutF
MDLKALHSISYGLYVITSKDGDEINGQVANTVFQISNDPPTIAISINKKNLTNEFIKKSGLFAVSVLSQETPLSLIGQFGFKSGRDVDKFRGVNYRTTPKGLPHLVDNVLASIEARVIQNCRCRNPRYFCRRDDSRRGPKTGQPNDLCLLSPG